MAAKAPTWYNGSVSKAATLAFRLKLILLACVVDKDSSKNKEKIDDILQSEKILPLVKRHCLCIRIDPDAAEQEALVHGHGSNDTEDSEYAELFERNSQLHEQRQEALRKLYMAENGKKENDERHISTIEAERYRKMLVKERRENHEQLKRLRSDIRNDRETYKMLHGETKNVTAVDKCEVSTKAEENKVRLLFRLSNGEAKEESFGKDAKFSTVREYIESTMGVVKSRSEIVLVRPWRVFDGDVDGRTLQELGLAPSATLLVRVWNTAPPGSTRNSPLTSRGLMLAVVVGILAAFLWWYRNGNTMPKRPVYLTLPPPAID
ncbi:hypothetical protein IW138_000399 [Coemansia sp. RSA 986]|nr:hypothetical protein IW138_000399 [Coemansia sp. RSA 986]